jgi:hypothetical protein
VDGGVGRYEFATHRVDLPGDVFNTAVDLFARLKGKEVYRTRWLRRHGLFDGCTALSYRNTVAQINEVRQQPGATVLRSLCNAAEDEAARLTQHLDRRADALLCAPRFDAQGRPAFRLGPEVAEDGLLPQSSVADAIRDCLAQNPRADIAADELAANPVPCEPPGSRPEISIDDVGVKKQRSARKRPAGNSPRKPQAATAAEALPGVEPAPGSSGDKGRKKVWTTVAHVQHAQAVYTLAAASVPAVLRLVSALLVSSGIAEAPLLFFTDGQRSLKDAIFDFWRERGRIRLILDWYHLQHKCRELGSHGLKGSIAAKRVHIEELRRLLWHGLVDRAMAYIDGLPPDAVRKPEVLLQIKGYLERNRPHIPCYALRSKLGLRCSSNPVEKQNDILVARRQKNNGMSWSEDGSHALSTLAAVRRNGELDQWLLTGTLAFALPEAQAA